MKRVCWVVLAALDSWQPRTIELYPTDVQIEDALGLKGRAQLVTLEVSKAPKSRVSKK